MTQVVDLDLASKWERDYAEKFSDNWSFGTRPYQSTFRIYAHFCQVDPQGTTANQTVIRIPAQTATCFNFGEGDQMILTPDVTGTNVVERPANDSDTNLAEGTKTNNGEDFCIQAVGLALRGFRYRLAQGSETQVVIAPADLLSGGPPVYDSAGALLADYGGGASSPTAVVAAPYAPATPAILLWEATLENSSFDLVWGKSKVEDFGRAGLLPPAGAAAIQLSHGIPDPMHGFEIPEGLAWTSSGPRSQLTARLTVNQDVYVMAGTRVSPAEGDEVKAVYLDIACVLRGISFCGPDVQAGGGAG